MHAYPAEGRLSLYWQDITIRKQVEEALRESEARLRGLVDSNIIGIFVHDLEGCIYEVNDAFLSLTGYTRTEFFEQHVTWSDLSPQKHREYRERAFQELIRTGTVQPFEKEYRRKDGTPVPVLGGGTIYRREGPSPLCIAWVTDLTAQKELERQKDLFLAMTSHELKTPLTALRGTLKLIQRRMTRVISTKEPLSPQLSRFFDKLSRGIADSVHQVDMQTRLINDLLDVSRITAGTLKLERVRCDLKNIVSQTVDALRMTAPSRTLSLDLPGQTPICVLADPDRVSQVVTNYVTNALRYSPADQPVQIDLAIGVQMARVWVRDHGPGLTEEAQAFLWQPFGQIKGVPIQSGSGKGLGLGLYICQMLIAQHQGQVGVESRPGEGSTFWFTLPLNPQT